MKYIWLIAFILLATTPAVAQEDSSSTLMCDMALTDRYVGGYHVDNDWFDAEYERMAAFVVDTYSHFAQFRTDKCGELAYYLTLRSLYNIDYTVWTPDGVAMLYEAIYDEVGGGDIADSPCAYDLFATYFEFSRAVERTTNVQTLIDVSIEMWRTAFSIAGNSSCDDDPVLELTRITIDYSNADVRDSIALDPRVFRAIYEEVSQQFED